MLVACLGTERMLPRRLTWSPQRGPRSEPVKLASSSTKASLPAKRPSRTASGFIVPTVVLLLLALARSLALNESYQPDRWSSPTSAHGPISGPIPLHHPGSVPSVSVFSSSLLVVCGAVCALVRGLFLSASGGSRRASIQRSLPLVVLRGELSCSLRCECALPFVWILVIMACYLLQPNLPADIASCLLAPYMAPSCSARFKFTPDCVVCWKLCFLCCAIHMHAEAVGLSPRKHKPGMAPLAHGDIFVRSISAHGMQRHGSKYVPSLSDSRLSSRPKRRER